MDTEASNLGFLMKGIGFFVLVYIGCVVVVGIKV